MAIKVLWADDEPSSLRFERALASNGGWQVTWAETVSEALRLVRDNKFDLVVVDLIMPRDDFQRSQGFADADAGISLIQTIQDRDRVGATGHDVPIVVISAIVTSNERLMVLEKLSSEEFYLSKPIDGEAFRQMVQNLEKMLGSSASGDSHC